MKITNDLHIEKNCKAFTDNSQKKYKMFNFVRHQEIAN